MSSRNLATPNVVFNEQSLVKALSAVVGSFVSSSLFYPLNVARLKLQCNPNVAGNMKQGLLSNFAFLKVIYHPPKSNQRQNAQPTWRNTKGVNFTIVMTTAELEMLEINRNA